LCSNSILEQKRPSSHGLGPASLVDTIQLPWFSASMEDVSLFPRTHSTPDAQDWRILVHHYNDAAYLARYQATGINCFPRTNSDITSELNGLMAENPNKVCGIRLGGVDRGRDSRSIASQFNQYSLNQPRPCRKPQRRHRTELTSCQCVILVAL